MTFALAGLVVFFQQHSAGIGGIAPVLMPDVPLKSVLLFALLNPVAVAVAWSLGTKLGRRADQPAKLLIAAFGSATAGAAALWLATLLKLSIVATPARAAGGIFVLSLFTGLVYAAVAYQLARRRT